MDNKSSKSTWQEIAPFLLMTTGWIVGPVIIGLISGTFLDNHFKTAPKYLLICVLSAFLLTMVGLTLEVIKYNRKQNSEKK